MAKTFVSHPYPSFDVPMSHVDLNNARKEAIVEKKPIRTGVIDIYYNAGCHYGAAEYIYLPEENRLGIAAGSDATWADVPNLSEGVDMWLNEPEEWEARN
jgi:hypothetical protein